MERLLKEWHVQMIHTSSPKNIAQTHASHCHSDWITAS